MNVIQTKRRTKKRSAASAARMLPSVSENAVENGNDDLIARTTALWRTHTARALTHEDGRQIVENMTGFFNVLQEWRRAETKKSKNEK